jgi:hypothetical protein
MPAQDAYRRASTGNDRGAATFQQLNDPANNAPMTSTRGRGRKMHPSAPQSLSEGIIIIMDRDQVVLRAPYSVHACL